MRTAGIGWCATVVLGAGVPGTGVLVHQFLCPSSGGITYFVVITYGSLRDVLSQLLSETDLPENHGCPNLLLPDHQTIRKTHTKPRYIISDKGPQFWGEGFKGWCGRHDIRPRFGTVGKHGSIAAVERSVKRPALQQRDRIFSAWLSDFGTAGECPSSWRRSRSAVRPESDA